MRRKLDRPGMRLSRKAQIMSDFPRDDVVIALLLCLELIVMGVPGLTVFAALGLVLVGVMLHTHK